jgi:chromosome segregation ATPase
LEPEFVSEYVRTYHEELESRRASNARERRGLERRLGEIKRKLERLVDHLVDGTDTPTTRERLFGLEAERREVETKLERIGQTRVIALHPGAAALYRRRIEDLEEALTGEESMQHYASAVLRNVIEKIVLHPGDARGEIEIELHGALAAILQLGEQKKTSGLDDTGGMTVMVAGARNHRELAMPPILV